MAAASLSALAQAYMNEEETKAYCAGRGITSRFCAGYGGIPFCDGDSECLRGWSVRQFHEGERRKERQQAEEERERRTLLAKPPLAEGANPLLGQWRRVAAGTLAQGLLAGLTEIFCAQLQGTGPSFEFRRDALVHGARAVSSMQYRAGPNNVVYAFGEREPLRQLAFRFQGKDNMTLASCAYQRVGAVAQGDAPAVASKASNPSSPGGRPSASGRAPASPQMASAAPSPPASGRPPPEVCRNTLLDQLGKVGVNQVRQMADRRFKETIEGKVPNSQNLRIDARGSACDDPRLNATLYDFDANGMLQSITFVLARPPGPTPAPIFQERLQTLSRVNPGGLPPPQSPGRLQADTLMGRLILQDMPERGLVLEAYSTGK
jgi:hypothetical protein